MLGNRIFDVRDEAIDFESAPLLLSRLGFLLLNLHQVSLSLLGRQPPMAS
jgi:hypothetical protein